MSWPASVRRREASPPHVFGGDEGLLRPTAAWQPYATADRGGHEARKDPVFALTEDASGPDDDDLEVARNAQQPLLFVSFSRSYACVGFNFERSVIRTRWSGPNTS